VTKECSQDSLAVRYGALGTVNGVVQSISSATVGLEWTVASLIVGFGFAALLRAAGTLALLRLEGIE